MSAKPVIAIAAELVEKPAGSAFTYSWNISSESYVQAVQRAGGVPFIIPKGSEELIRFADGLLMQGGKDIDPLSYREERHQLCGASDIEEDEFHKTLIIAANDRNMPILGICRGLQIINTVFGGTLYQDQSEGGFIKHSRYDRPEDGVHEVWVEEGSFLERIFHRRTLFVNSLHHQMIKDLAPGFRTAACTGDGSIEAIEKGNIIAVQWHPEAMSQKRTEMSALFSYFISLCD